MSLPSTNGKKNREFEGGAKFKLINIERISGLSEPFPIIYIYNIIFF
jgi:hypothetical protein